MVNAWERGMLAKCAEAGCPLGEQEGPWWDEPTQEQNIPTDPSDPTYAGCFEPCTGRQLCPADETEACCHCATYMQPRGLSVCWQEHCSEDVERMDVSLIRWWDGMHAECGPLIASGGCTSYAMPVGSPGITPYLTVPIPRDGSLPQEATLHMSTCFQKCVETSRECLGENADNCCYCKVAFDFQYGGPEPFGEVDRQGIHRCVQTCVDESPEDPSGYDTMNVEEMAVLSLISNCELLMGQWCDVDWKKAPKYDELVATLPTSPTSTAPVVEETPDQEPNVAKSAAGGSSAQTTSDEEPPAQETGVEEEQAGETSDDRWLEVGEKGPILTFPACFEKPFDNEGCQKGDSETPADPCCRCGYLENTLAWIDARRANTSLSQNEGLEGSAFFEYASDICTSEGSLPMLNFDNFTAAVADVARDCESLIIGEWCVVDGLEKWRWHKSQKLVNATEPTSSANGMMTPSFSMMTVGLVAVLLGAGFSVLA